jgi:hypothetical protein
MAAFLKVTAVAAKTAFTRPVFSAGTRFRTSTKTANGELPHAAVKALT